MKITIELTEAQVKGIKAYNKDTDHLEKTTKKDIANYISGIVHMTLEIEAVNDYIKKYES